MSNKPSRNQPQQQKPPIQMQRQSFYQGIIPSPEALAQYESLQPGFASRIVKMTEDESHHRRTQEARIITGSIRSTYYGITLGFLAVIALCVLAYLFLINGSPEHGKHIVITLAIGLASVFVFRRSNNQKKPTANTP